MKQLITALLLLIAIPTQAQSWVLVRKTDTTPVYRVQCWGTTKKDTRCKRMVDIYKPNKAVRDKTGRYYCAQHNNQVK